MKLAEAEARTAVDLDPGSSIAHAILALVFSYKGDREPSLEEAEIAIALNPNDPTGHLCKGFTLTFSGGAAAGRESLATTLRLDPRGPTQPHAICNQAIGCYFERDYAAAEAMARRTIRAYPASPRPYSWLPAPLAQLGKVDEARAALDTAIAVASSHLKFLTAGRPAYIRPEDHEHLLEGLRISVTSRLPRLRLCRAPTHKIGSRERSEGRMAALDLLRDARQVLADEGNWCQHHAVQPSGRGKSVLGAVGYRFYAADHPDTMAAVQLLARAIGRGSSIYDSVFVRDFNDMHGHAEPALLDKAMALAESDAAKEPVAPPDAEPGPWWRDQVPCSAAMTETRRTVRPSPRRRSVADRCRRPASIARA
jgi:tetratricopeptide (TPR) repeat protein